MLSTAPAYNERIGSEIVSPLVTVEAVEFGAAITMVAISRDNETCAVSLADGRVALLDSISGDDPFEQPGHRIDLTAHDGPVVAVCRLGAFFASAGEDGRILRINPMDVGTRLLWAAQGQGIAALVSDHAGSRLGAAAGRNVVAIADDGTVLCHAMLDMAVTGLAFDPSGARLAASHEGGVSIIDVASGHIAVALSWPGPHLGVSWSPDGRFIVSATQANELHVWDLQRSREFRLGGYDTPVRQLTWSRAPKVLTCSGADVATAWPFEGKGPEGQVPAEFGFVVDGLVTAVAARPGGVVVAAGYDTGNILIGATSKGEALLVRGHTGTPVTSLAWTPDGAHLLVADAAGTIVRIVVPGELPLR